MQNKVSERNQAEKTDGPIDWHAFAELRDRCEQINEPWLADADLYDENGAPAVTGEKKETAMSTDEGDIYRPKGGVVVTDADFEADVDRFEAREWTGEWRVLLTRPPLPDEARKPHSLVTPPETAAGIN